MLRTRLDNGVATITLARPELLNALSWELMDRLREAVDTLGQDPATRVLVITGEGRAFCGGADLAGMGADRPELGRRIADVMAHSVNPLCTAIAESPVPVLAAVNGPCVGGGVGVALLADVTVAARSAYFLVPHVPTLDIAPDLGLSWVMARRAGQARALGITLLGDRISAQQAAEWGLIWQCVDDAEFPKQVEGLARRLADLDPAAAVSTRQLLSQGHSAALAEQLAAERSHQRALFDRPGPAERILGFLNRRGSGRK
ncbi:enoyl-CoA hydratase/isomerase family protein [Streptomyces sp. NPDC005498]|uniref:enoyl-CoA hydratase/isomerase family protein n=1 Tax=Streptomyces sp. NPDC005498 TaxID=3364717 RepID=UPI0036A99C59